MTARQRERIAEARVLVDVAEEILNSVVDEVTPVSAEGKVYQAQSGLQEIAGLLSRLR